MAIAPARWRSRWRRLKSSIAFTQESISSFFWHGHIQRRSRGGCRWRVHWNCKIRKFSILKTLTSSNFGTRWSAVIEICLCAPFEGTTRAFLLPAENGQNRAVYNTYPQLSNSILRIKLRGNSVTEFNNMYLDSYASQYSNFVKPQLFECSKLLWTCILAIIGVIVRSKVTL